MTTYNFEIYLFGLICVYGDSPERNAPPRKSETVLLQDADHTPVIYLNNSTKIELTKDVSFRNLKGGSTDVLSSFDTLVPHLARITKPYNGSGLPVRLKPDAAGIRVTLPAGPLMTVDTYPKHGKYVLDQVVIYSGCVGRVTYLRATAEEGEVIVKFNDTKRSIPPDGWVLIGNVDKQDQTEPIADEDERPGFKKHYKATDGTVDDIATLFELTNYDCNTPIINPPDLKPLHLDEVLSIVIRSPIALHPECSNTQWP